MKVATYVAGGRERLGFIVGDDVVDAPPEMKDMKAFIESGAEGAQHILARVCLLMAVRKVAERFAIELTAAILTAVLDVAIRRGTAQLQDVLVYGRRPTERVESHPRGIANALPAFATIVCLPSTPRAARCPKAYRLCVSSPGRIRFSTARNCSPRATRKCRRTRRCSSVSV